MNSKDFKNVRVIQGTVSPGFGGLELVIIEFHQWLMNQGVESFVMALEGTPLEKNLLQRGFRQSTISIPKNRPQDMRVWRKKLDASNVAFLFHRHQGLKQLRFTSFKAKISALSHTFYDVKKTDLWHRYIFSRVNQWIALTPRHRANLVETTGVNENKICIIPNGVDLKKFTPKFKEIPAKSETVRVGVLARLDRKKGQDLAIRALRFLVNEGSRKWCLHLYGEDTPAEIPIHPELEKLAEDLGVRDQVFFEGYHDDLPAQTQKLDLIWMPSQKETFGRCIIEGMASGVPVIASDAGGVPDIIQHRQNGMLFQTEDADDLFSKTLEILNDKDLFRRIQIQARKDVEAKYNVDEIWPRLFSAIKP
jgi:glycosyltransferase involved in cell wall biosynthesis